MGKEELAVALCERPINTEVCSSWAQNATKYPKWAAKVVEEVDPEEKCDHLAVCESVRDAVQRCSMADRLVWSRWCSWPTLMQQHPQTATCQHRSLCCRNSCWAYWLCLQISRNDVKLLERRYDTENLHLQQRWDALNNAKAAMSSAVARSLVWCVHPL